MKTFFSISTVVLGLFCSVLPVHGYAHFLIDGGHVSASSNARQLLEDARGGDVDAITASTITTRAFLGAVNDAYKAYCGQAVDGNSSATQQVNEVAGGVDKTACCGDPAKCEANFCTGDKENCVCGNN